jgi:hypothetical protein
VAKREKDKYLEKKAKILAMALKEGSEGTKGWRRGPNRKDRKTLLGGTNAHTVGKKDIGKMSALTRGKRKR